MERALYVIYSLVEADQKTYLFAALSRSFSDTFQLVNDKQLLDGFFFVIFGIVLSAETES